MSTISNQQNFEDFQRSVDQAIILAKTLAPEHFYLAYDRCAKLQKLIFKRACGYCSSKETTVEFMDTTINEQLKAAPFNLCYLNLPTLSLCGTTIPVTQPLKANEDVIDSHREVMIDKLILLTDKNVYPPSETEIEELEKMYRVALKCRLPLVSTVHGAAECLLRNFPGTNKSECDLCLPNAENTHFLEPLLDLSFVTLSQPIPILYLRPVKVPDKHKAESSISPSSFSHSDASTNSCRVNSFIVDTDKRPLKCEDAVQDECVFPEPHFPPMDTKPYNPVVNRVVQQRKYNWSVVLTKLHEKSPVSLSHEILPCPNKCHELHTIPPTTQKLRPTKRCQLCLRSYGKRKESRYYCQACDKGFHIKCFDVYHAQVGCKDFTIRITGTEH